MKCDLKDEIPSKYFNLWYCENQQVYRLLTITDGLVKLNSMAAYIWTLIDGKRSVENIWTEICSKYPTIDPEIVKKDVITVINQLLEYEVITLSWEKFGENKL